MYAKSEVFPGEEVVCDFMGEYAGFKHHLDQFESEELDHGQHIPELTRFESRSCQVGVLELSSRWRVFLERSLGGVWMGIFLRAPH